MAAELLAAGGGRHGLGLGVGAATVTQRSRCRKSWTRPAINVVNRCWISLQVPVDRGVLAGGGVDRVDGDLGVLDPARSAGVLALHAHGRGALLQVAGLVDHEHGVGVVQVLDHVGAYVVADRVGVPLRTVQQVLHAVRGGVTRVLGQGPAVLPR